MIRLNSNKAQIVFILGWLIILARVLVMGWDHAWGSLFVPAMTPEFADMRTVQGSLSSLSNGLNPQVTNPGDPWNRPMNYPSIWILIAQTMSLQNETNYLVFVSVMVTLFISCCFFLVKQFPSITLLLMCFSGATLLAVERGNNDMLIFSLLYVAALLPAYGYLFAIFTAIILKIFPIVAIPVFIRSFRDVVVMIVIVLIGAIILLPELSIIKSGIPISDSLSYGSSSIVAVAQNFNISVPAIGVSGLLILLSLTISLLSTFKVGLLASNATCHENQLFLLGSCIYIGTFILSSNWDYRLIFLIFCVPYVVRLDGIFFRLGVSLLLIFSLNQLLLNALMGDFGIGINILSKIALFIVIAAMTYLQLRNNFAKMNFYNVLQKIRKN